MKRRFLFLLFFLMVLMSPMGVRATQIVNNFGLSSPASTLTFDEIVFSPGTAIATQYAAYGETFTPSLVYDVLGTQSLPGITGNNLGNFNPVVNPFSIFFTTQQTEAAFGMATYPAQTTFTALLNGTTVESFSVSTTLDDPNTGFYGFSGITFNEISIFVNNDNGFALIDNIQTGINTVPEPSTMLFLGSCLIVLAGLKRKFKR